MQARVDSELSDIAQEEVARKNPPEMPSFNDNTPPASNILSNTGNCAHRNRLSSAPLQPVMLMTGTTKATASSPPPMMEMVQKRGMDKLFDAATTPQTKSVVAKVHVQLTQKDAPFTTVVDRYQDVQSSQDISSTCINLQRALG